MLRTILAASIVGLAVIGATTAALPQDVTFNYAGTGFAVSKTSPVAISGTVDIEFGARLEKSEDGTPTSALSTPTRPTSPSSTPSACRAPSPASRGSPPALPAIPSRTASNSVSKIQTANFAKILLLIQGPFTDE
jgi:hypothetical protein